MPINMMGGRNDIIQNGVGINPHLKGAVGINPHP